MRALRGCLLGIAIFQGLSAWVGMVVMVSIWNKHVHWAVRVGGDG